MTIECKGKNVKEQSRTELIFEVKRGKQIGLAQLRWGEVDQKMSHFMGLITALLQTKKAILTQTQVNTSVELSFGEFLPIG